MADLHLNSSLIAEAAAEYREQCHEIPVTGKNVSHVTLVRASGILPVPINWIWPEWLACGKLHICAGPPGTGKTTLAIALAAIVSSGQKFPDGSSFPAANVAIWSGEDDTKDTLVPRLMAAGADMNRVYFVGECKSGENVRAFDPSKDIELLRRAIDQIGGAALIIVDPIVSAVSGDSHKNSETRRALQPLVDLASTCDAALLGITHLTKGTTGRDPLERLTGSLAFGAMARVVFMAAKETDGDPDEESTKRYFMRVKSNIGPDGGAYTYDLISLPLVDNPEIITSRVEFGDWVEGAARDILDAAEVVDEDKSAAREALDFLRDLLAGGPHKASDVIKASKAAGVSERTLRRAKNKLRVRSIRMPFDNCWAWILPQDGQDHSMPAKPQNLAALAALNESLPEVDNHGDTRKGGQPYVKVANDSRESANSYEEILEDGHLSMVGKLVAHPHEGSSDDEVTL